MKTDVNVSKDDKTTGLGNGHNETVNETDDVQLPMQDRVLKRQTWRDT